MSFRRRMQRLSLKEIRLTDSFWTRWQSLLCDVTLEAEWQQIVDTGRLDNFKNAAAKRTDPEAFRGLYFNDSDVYKWCEAAGYVLALGPDAGIQAHLDEVIGAIEAAQEPDGYINTFFQIRRPQLKWRNLLAMHEMYCGGHLIEAGVALFESTGDRRLLNVALKFADHVLSVFGPGRRRGYCGHQEIELALIRLSEATGDPKYRDLARWMIEERGQRPSALEPELNDPEAMSLSPWANGMLRKGGVYDGEYAQDHAPIREHTEIVGHAVRAMYFYIAATFLAEGDAELEETLKRIWQNLTRKRMYITGGIGPSSSNEGFTGDYDLPNLTAYAETCAACGLVFWGQKLLEMTGESEYADVVERALYNGVVSGLSLSGDRFFYANPLESRGSHQRVPWYECACCPPNIARLLASAAWYVASVSEHAFWIHIPAGFEATAEIHGVKVKIVVESDYPWDGRIKVRIDPERPVAFQLRLRIPDWADEVETDLPGLGSAAAWEGGYAVFEKEFGRGDVLSVDFGTEPSWVECDPRVRDNLGRVALCRGPLVYCAEERDLGFAPQTFVADTEVAPQILHSDGVVRLQVEGFAENDAFVGELYAREGTTEVREAQAIFIPYYTWNNRGPNAMQVWIRRA